MFKYKISDKRLKNAENIINEYWRERYATYNKNKQEWQKPILELLLKHGFKKCGKNSFHRDIILINGNAKIKYYNKIELNWPFNCTFYNNTYCSIPDRPVELHLSLLQNFLEIKFPIDKIYIETSRYNKITLTKLIK